MDVVFFAVHLKNIFFSLKLHFNPSLYKNIKPNATFCYWHVLALQLAPQIGAGLVTVFKCLPKKEFLCLNPASRMTLLANATILRGVACTSVKIHAKEFTSFFHACRLFTGTWKYEIATHSFKCLPLKEFLI